MKSSALFQTLSATTFALLLLAPPAWANGNQDMAEARRIHTRERMQCMRGQSPQGRETCLKEAGAAFQEARRGALARGADSDLVENAVRRCDVQPEADRPACVQRIRGGSTEGSVGGGGLIRQTETRLP